MWGRANATPGTPPGKPPGTPLSPEELKQLASEAKHARKLALDKAANLLAEASKELLPWDRGGAEELFELAMTYRSEAQKVLEFGT